MEIAGDETTEFQVRLLPKDIIVPNDLRKYNLSKLMNGEAVS